MYFISLSPEICQLNTFVPVFEPAQPFNWGLNCVCSDTFRFMTSSYFLVVLKIFTVMKDVSNRSCGGYHNIMSSAMSRFNKADKIQFRLPVKCSKNKFSH
jgi:hypothetical protein